MTEAQLEKRRAYSRAWYRRNREAVLAKQRERLQQPEVRERRNKRKRERRAADGNFRERQNDYTTAWKRQQKYGITSEQYDELLASQGGVCAICGQPERSKSRNGHLLKLAVDHDHETGTVRGLLCDRCNRGLGFFGDDPERLAAAIAYLQEIREC